MQTRLSVDIGGTFTDAVLESGSGVVSTKVLTTPGAPELAMLAGIAEVLALAGVEPAAVDVLVHGTTLATNALIERKGALTGCLVNAGFRDVLATGDEKRYAHYDLGIVKPEPLVPRWLRLPVRGRIAADGSEVEALRLEDIDAAAGILAEAGVQSVAIGFLHAYANSAHERAAAERLAQRLPSVAVSLSSEVCPEMREYERFSTTVANAYVRPLIERYLSALGARLSALGFTCPLYLVTSTGSLTTLETATRFPIRLVESGPAGGAILAGRLAHELGLRDALSFDMGGTTAKICFITDGQADHSRRFEVARAYRNLKGSGLPIRIPVVEMVEIGAGGGSIARVDRLGRITVGPDSAGAEPGPACYGRGGSQATVTDANLATGRFDPHGFAGGRIALWRQRAADALMNAVGLPQQLDATWAAAGVIEIVEENMANAARVHAIERGKVIERNTLIAFGGAAPMHAAQLARKLGISRVLVPRGAGVGSALGFLHAPLAYENVRSFNVREGRVDGARVDALLAQIEAEARAIVAAGAPGAVLRSARHVDVRYVGQGHELAVPLPDGAVDAAALRRVRDDFERRYEAQYGVRIPGVELEFLTWTVTVAGPPAAADAAPQACREHIAAATGEREIFDAGAGCAVRAAVHAREGLRPGACAPGPALVEEAQTTTYVPAGWRVRLDGHGNLELEPAGAGD